MFSNRFLFLVLPFGLLVAGETSDARVLAQNVQDHGAEDKDAAQTAKKISEALAKLPEADRKLAESQRFCPVMAYSRLGADGTPVKVEIEGRHVFVCCGACVAIAKRDGAKAIETAKKLTDVSAVLAKLPAADRAAAEAQKFCAIANESFLGAMGEPIKLELKGKPVFLCCQGCVAKAQADPDAALAKVEELKKAGAGHDHGHGDHGHGGGDSADKH